MGNLCKKNGSNASIINDPVVLPVVHRESASQYRKDMVSEVKDLKKLRRRSESPRQSSFQGQPPSTHKVYRIRKTISMIPSVSEPITSNNVSNNNATNIFHTLIFGPAVNSSSTYGNFLEAHPLGEPIAYGDCIILRNLRTKQPLTTKYMRIGALLMQQQTASHHNPVRLADAGDEEDDEEYPYLIWRVHEDKSQQNGICLEHVLTNTFLSSSIAHKHAQVPVAQLVFTMPSGKIANQQTWEIDRFPHQAAAAAEQLHSTMAAQADVGVVTTAVLVNQLFRMKHTETGMFLSSADSNDICCRAIPPFQNRNSLKQESNNLSSLKSQPMSVMSAELSPHSKQFVDNTIIGEGEEVEGEEEQLANLDQTSMFLDSYPSPTHNRLNIEHSERQTSSRHFEFLVRNAELWYVSNIIDYE